MKFCKKCGKPLIMVDNIARCYCGYTEKATNISAKQKIPKKEEKGEGIAEKDPTEKGFPHICKKCGNTERDAYGSSNA